MPTNNYLPFCGTDSGTNLLTNSAYLASTGRTGGNVPGIASSALNNKAVRQSSFWTSQIAQFFADVKGVDVTDVDGITTTLLGLLKGSLVPRTPIIQTFLSGSGTYNRTYAFAIASPTTAPTSGATYTNNGITYTVAKDVGSGGLIMYASGSNVPLASGTLTKAAGTGDATLTFYSYSAPLYLKVKCVGAGGGGGGSGNTGTGGTGGTGGNTTFGTSLLTANGGTGGSPQAGGAATGGTGGTASIGTGGYGLALPGAFGGGGGFSSLATVNQSGGMGGASPLGGAGSGDTTTVTAGTNTGSGGGGGFRGGTGSSGGSGGGGGAGGYVEAVIPSPAITYSYAVGAAGSAGTAGTGGNVGGLGGSGAILVEECYQ